MDFLNKSEIRIIKVMRKLSEADQKQLETFVISLKPKQTKNTGKKKNTISNDPVAKWRGSFKGKCSSSEDFAKRKELEKLLER